MQFTIRTNVGNSHDIEVVKAAKNWEVGIVNWELQLQLELELQIPPTRGRGGPSALWQPVGLFFEFIFFPRILGLIFNAFLSLHNQSKECEFALAPLFSRFFVCCFYYFLYSSSAFSVLLCLCNLQLNKFLICFWCFQRNQFAISHHICRRADASWSLQLHLVVMGEKVGGDEKYNCP